jgi:Gluconate 2-dehydrogenase subunit 3
VSPERAGSPLTRRRLLQLSGGATVALAAGSWLAMRGSAEHYRRLVGGATPAVLSVKELAVLFAAVDRLLPAEPGWLTAREARVAERIDRELAFHTRKFQGDVKAALFVVEHGGLARGRLTRFSKLTEAEQDAHLQVMAEGKDLERQALSALKVFASFFYYCDERAWPSIHYQGPLVQTASAPEADSRVAPRPG